MNDLLDRLYAAGFTVELTASGPRLLPVRRGLTVPPDLLEEVKQNRAEIVLHLMATARPNIADAEFCRVCARLVHPDDRTHLIDPAHCERGGAPAMRDRQGNVVQAAVPRCPFKENA